MRQPRHCWVYPRVGGGASTGITRSTRSEGLSSRGRGNREGAPEDVAGVRSIPAWAGEPVAIGVYIGAIAVYPRVGGGTMKS